MHHRFRSLHGLKPGIKKGKALAKSILSEGIFASNIDTSQSDTIRVNLWHEWRTMLEDLRKIGPVWRMVRNGHCVLAQLGAYPELAFSSDLQVANSFHDDSSMICHFEAWRAATAFDAACCCGRIYGVEIENALGEIFHKICLAKDTDISLFAEWTQLHQATGLEIGNAEMDYPTCGCSPISPAANVLQVTPDRLRTVLIAAAQREIPLVVGVASEGITQTARIEVTKAVENNGWLALSGQQRSLYVTSEPTGSLRVESRTLEGESIWVLSLVHPDGHSLMQVQTEVDSRTDWNRLVQQSVLCAPQNEN